MRGLFGIVVVLSTRIAIADPSWTDTPALLDAALAPHAEALRACIDKLPRDIGFFASRTKTNTTAVSMPLYGVGHRGPTPEETCLAGAIAKIELPPLPTEVDRIGFRYTIVTAGAPPAKHEKRFDDWRDPSATLATVIDAAKRASLGACDRKARTARLNVDLRSGKTRIWLPAWQFHSPKGDGSTPPAEAKVKACMTKAIRGWTAPVLPMAMGEIQLAFTIRPTTSP
jgi:hypothetical protein